MKDLAIVILNYNTNKLLKNCIESILKDNDSDSVWVIDNASTDDSLEMLKKNFPKINLIVNKDNYGYSKGYNEGLKKINSKVYLLLNSDTEVRGDNINKLINCLTDSDYSIMSPKLIYPNGEFQPNAGDLPFGFSLISWIAGIDDLFNKIGINLPSFHRIDKKYYQDKKRVGWVAGTAMAIKKTVMDNIGLLDEKIFMYAEDVDYCNRANNAGFKIGICLESEIIHIGGGSSNDAKFKQWLGEFKGLVYLYKKYYGQIAANLLLGLIYFFATLRMFIFYLIGKKEFAQNYGKIIKAL